MSKEYKYKGLLTITLDDEYNYIESIKTNLPVLGEGMDRIVYELPNNKCLKVAKSIRASCINYDEIMLYENIKGKKCIIQFPEVFEYEENWGLWYVYEKINMSSKAMNEATKLVPVLDQADNAGYNSKGQLTIVDAENINYTWFLKETNPFVKE